MRLNVTMAVLVGVNLAGSAWGDSQADAQAKRRVLAAITLYPVDAERARRELKVIDGPGVQYVVQALWCREATTAPERQFLVRAISETDASESRLALANLLSHWDPIVRGDSAAYLGTRRAREAVPALAGLLDDEDIYLTRVATDPHTKESILVRDKAIKALEQITGVVRGQGQSPREKAKAWKSWVEDRPKRE